MLQFYNLYYIITIFQLQLIRGCEGSEYLKYLDIKNRVTTIPLTFAKVKMCVGSKYI